jgi:hypothetical protein
MKLSELIKTEEIKIPETDIVIKIKNELSWFEFLEGIKISDSSEKGIYTIAKMVVSWNLTDDDGKNLPVTEENVKMLPKEVALLLIERFSKIFEENSKKKAN